jgi:PhnB protein
VEAFYVNLLVSDVARAAHFYRDALGFTVEQAMTGPDGVPVWATLRHGPARLMLETGASFGGSPVPMGTAAGAGVRLYAELAPGDDVDARSRLAEAHGATVVEPPADQFFGARTCTIRDPDGYLLMLSQPTGAADFGPMTVLAGPEADRALG